MTPPKPKITLDNVDQTVFGKILDSISTLSNEISVVKTDIGYIKDHAEEQRKCSVDMVNILKGNGGKGEVGLIGRVRIIESWIGVRVWLERAVVAVLIAQIVGLIFALLQNKELLSLLAK